MRSASSIIQQIAYERNLAMSCGGDPERLPPLHITPDEYYSVCYTHSTDTPMYQIDRDIRLGTPRPFMGRKLALQYHSGNQETKS